ncbi:MAG: site-specific DNA-methyltransferase [Anaerolineales bacterium]
MPTLHWLGRDEATRAAGLIPYRLLEPLPGDESPGYHDADNLLIQGDNLHALKALLPYYAGQVKCIYIDPPYNTRSAFEHYDDNLEHATWLSMMYPRLELLRDLLAEDGSIWVSIDDNEGHYLKVVMDEVFGRGNFVTSFIWQKVDSPNDNKVPITPDHEYILCYTRDAAQANFKKLGDASVLDAFPHIDSRGRHFRDRLLKKNGKSSLREDRPTMFFAIPGPDGKDVHPVHDDGREARWSFGKKQVFEMLRSGELVWKERVLNGEKRWVPYTREFAPDNPSRPNPTILLDVKTSRQAKAHQRELLPSAEIFDTVKPEQLIERILNIATVPGDLVLDSFLGSGTTAAVAHKMGRRWIGIEMGEHALTHCLPRLQKVVAGEQGGISSAVNWQGGGGFRVARLGEAIFDEQGQINPKVRFGALAAHVWFIETGRPLAVHKRSPLLGVHDGVAYYLLYNGILGDKSTDGGNILTRRTLAQLPTFDGAKVIYGEGARLGLERLKALGITFKQTPYDIKVK